MVTAVKLMYARYVACFSLVLNGLARESYVDWDDLARASEALRTEMPQVNTLPIQHCLQSDHPYTIRMSVQEGSVLQRVDCVRPWRTHAWHCSSVVNDEDEEDCLR